MDKSYKQALGVLIRKNDKIRKLRAQGKSIIELARDFGISKQRVSQICQKKPKAQPEA